MTEQHLITQEICRFHEKMGESRAERTEQHFHPFQYWQQQQKQRRSPHSFFTVSCTFFVVRLKEIGNGRK